MSLPIPTSPTYWTEFKNLIPGPRSSGIDGFPSDPRRRVHSMVGLPNATAVQLVDTDGRAVSAHHVTDDVWTYYHDRRPMDRDEIEAALTHIKAQDQRGLLSDTAKGHLRGFFRESMARLPEGER